MAGSRIGFIGPSRQVTHHAAQNVVTYHDPEETTRVHKIKRTPCAIYGHSERPNEHHFRPKTAERSAGLRPVGRDRRSGTERLSPRNAKPQLGCIACPAPSLASFVSNNLGPIFDHEFYEFTRMHAGIYGLLPGSICLVPIRVNSRNSWSKNPMRCLCSAFMSA